MINSNKKTLIKILKNRSPGERSTCKMKPLEFIKNDPKSSRKNQIDEYHEEKIQINENFENNQLYSENKKSLYLENLFDETNYTPKDENLRTPTTGYRVYVEDTPVDYYGLSVFERRKKGLNC